MEVKVVSSEITERIITEQQLLEIYNISLDEWEVEKKIINTWEVGSKTPTGEMAVTPLFQVKVFLKSKKEVKDLEDIRKDFIEDMKKLSPVVKSKHVKNISKDPVVVEIDIFDLHLGKFSWSEEVGHSYNTDIAIGMYNDAIDYFIEHTKHLNIEKFLLPVGSDLFHYDVSTPYNSTTKGTPQDTDGLHWKDVFRKGRQMLIENINKLKEIAPVDVVSTYSNHDNSKVYYLNDSLYSWYHNDENVTVDNSPSPRKYYHYGVNLIGLTHGDNEKLSNLPLIMASETGTLWSITTNREFHVGHLHTTRVTSYQPTAEYNGVIVRHMSSLSGTDSWHKSRGYVGNRRAAECYVLDKERGTTQILNYII